jgi:hypothetical protein
MDVAKTGHPLLWEKNKHRWIKVQPHKALLTEQAFLIPLLTSDPLPLLPPSFMARRM